MKLYIKPHNDVAWEFYKNHGHFHEGDAGRRRVHQHESK